MMIGSFFQPRHHAATVIRGAQRRRVWMHGDRIVIGSNHDADLVLSGLGINTNQLILTRVKETSFWPYDKQFRRRSGWMYRFDDDPRNALDGKPAPRAGILYDDAKLTLGGYADIVVRPEPIDRTAPEEVIKSKASAFIPVEYVGIANFFAMLGFFAIVLYLVFFLGGQREAAKPYSMHVETWFASIWSGGQSQDVWFSSQFGDCRLADPGKTGAPVFSDLVTQAALRLQSGDRMSAAETLRELDTLIGGECIASQKIRCDIIHLTAKIKPDWCMEISD